MAFTKKILYHLNGFDDLWIMCGLVINLLLRIEGGLLDMLHLFHDAPLIKQIGTRP
jgi:hypothetical protein